MKQKRRHRKREILIPYPPHKQDKYIYLQGRNAEKPFWLAIDYVRKIWGYWNVESLSYVKEYFRQNTSVDQLDPRVLVFR